MKFEWFHLMPYRDLPKDFADRYRSIWVDIPSTLFDSEVVHALYNDYLDELEFAASVGFDGICVNEHHSNGYGMMPSPNIMAATLARRTQDCAIIILGNSVALYNPPLRVAEEMAMLDCVSGGRLVAGFPVGSAADVNWAYGQNPALIRRRYLEACQLIVRAWREDEVFSFNGEFNQHRYVNVTPKPLQKPHPPIWIPGGGSVETWDFCADQGYVYCALSYGGYKLGKRTLDGFWQVMREKEKPLNPYHAGFLQLIACAETRSEAEDKFGPHAEYFYNKMLHIDPAFFDAPGYRTLSSIEAGFSRGAVAGPVFNDSTRFKDNTAAKRYVATANTPKGEASFQDLTEAGNIVAGTPNDVAEQLEEGIRSLHVGHLMCLCQFGSVPHDLAMANSQIVAEQVLPKIRQIWDAEGWQDQWWPSPLRRTQRPAAIRSRAVAT